MMTKEDVAHKFPILVDLSADMSKRMQFATENYFKLCEIAGIPDSIASASYLSVQMIGISRAIAYLSDMPIDEACRVFRLVLTEEKAKCPPATSTTV